MIDVKDIPPEMKDAILRELPNSTKYRDAMLSRDNCIRNKDFLSALKYGKIMKSIEEIALKQFAERLEYEQMSMKDIMQKMTAEDSEITNRKLFSIMFLSDIIETCTIEINERIHKVDKETSIPSLMQIQELGKQLGRLCRQAVGNGELSILFADYADDVTTLIDNKVKSMLRKSVSIDCGRNKVK